MPQLKQDALHWSLADIEKYLNSFSPPKGDFDPTGEWTHQYIIWINTNKSQSPSRSQGYVKLQRRRPFIMKKCPVCP